MICNKCGANISDDARFCEECGTKVEIVEQQIVKDTKNNDVVYSNNIVENNNSETKKTKMPLLIAIASIFTVLLLGIIVAICIGVSNSHSKDNDGTIDRALVQKEAYDNGYILYSSTKSNNGAYNHTLIKVNDQSTYKLSCTEKYIEDVQLLKNENEVMYISGSNDSLFLEDMSSHDLKMIDESVKKYYINNENKLVFYHTYDNELIMYDFVTCRIVSDNVSQFIFSNNKILFVVDKNVYFMNADKNCEKQIINFNLDEDIQEIEVQYYSDDFSNIYVIAVDKNEDAYIFTNKGYSEKISNNKILYDLDVKKNGKLYITYSDKEYMTFDLYCFDGKEWANLISNAGQIGVMNEEDNDLAAALIENNIVIFKDGKKHIVNSFNDEAGYPIISKDGSILYYLNYDEELSKLYKIDVASNTKTLLSDTIVSLDDMQEIMDVSDNGLLYLDNCKVLDDYTGCGDLYYDKIKIDSDVCSAEAKIDKNIIYYIKNYNVNTDVYDLYMYKDAKSKKCFTNVSDFYVNDEGIMFVECVDGNYTDVYMVVNNKKVLIINDMADGYDYESNIILSSK